MDHLVDKLLFVVGGASGGGSINIFYKEAYANDGIINAEGGNEGHSQNDGGAGGNGSISIGKITNGEYIEIGAGTENNPFKIKTQEDLQKLRYSKEDVYYCLSNNINITTPIEALATKDKPFEGHLNGNGYIINNLTIENETEYQGLLGYIGKKGSIKDLNIQTSKTGITGTNYVGGLAGYNEGTIENVKVSGKISGINNIGGIVGYNIGTIKNSSSTGTVTISNTETTASKSAIGGLAGYNGKSATIESCYSNSNIEISVTNMNYIGGLVGYNDIYATINKCVADGIVNANNIGNQYIGGLVGCNSTGYIYNSYSTGTVNGKAYVGGLTGASFGKKSTEEWSEIAACYTIAKVSGESYVGALIGKINDYSSVESSYWVKAFCEYPTSAAGECVPITWFVNKDNLVELFDFENVWKIENKKTFPYIDGVTIPDKIKVIENGFEIFEQGIGTEDDPYIIKTEKQLERINDVSGYYYKLNNDIKLTNSNFKPLGSENDKFTGILDGNGHKISNLQINNEQLDYQGLLGYISEDAYISNLVIETTQTGIVGNKYVGILAGYNKGIIYNVTVNGTVKGNSNIGGLVGYNANTVQNSSSSGEVVMKESGTSQNYKEAVGGLVGYNGQSAVIELCYSNSNISGSTENIAYWKYIGGLVGYNAKYSDVHQSATSGTIVATGEKNTYIGGLVGYNSIASVYNSYSVGKVSGNSNVGGLIGYSGGTTKEDAYIGACYTIAKVSGNTDVGGLVGITYHTTTENSYWTKAETGCTRSASGSVATITWLINRSNMENVWDMETIWGLEDKKTLPYINGITIPNEIYVVNNGYITFDSGDGTEENPYIIKTEKQLEKVNDVLSAYFKLANDIKLTTSNFKPIGNQDEKFYGNFDGNGHKITNLQINDETSDYQGLFGYIEEGATIYNLEIETTSTGIVGKSYVGILAGYNKGSITNVKVTGNISGTSYVGGLVGQNSYYATINQTISNVKVECNTGSYIGGLVGYNYLAYIYNSYSTGTVTGKYYVGGLVGYTSGKKSTNEYAEIACCYSISKVTGTSSVEPLIGSRYYTNGTETTYWSSETSGLSTGYYGNKKTLEEMKNQETYVDWDFKENSSDTEYVWYMKTYPELKDF